MLSIVVGPGPLTDAAAEKQPGLLQTQDFSPASDCDLAMPQSDTKSFVGAPESPSGASGAPQKKGGLAQFIQHVLGYKFLLLGVGSAVAIWIVLQLLNLTIFSDIAFLAAEILASLLLIRIGVDIAASGNVGDAESIPDLIKLMDDGDSKVCHTQAHACVSRPALDAVNCTKQPGPTSRRLSWTPGRRLTCWPAPRRRDMECA